MAVIFIINFVGLYLIQFQAQARRHMKHIHHKKTHTHSQTNTKLEHSPRV